MLHDLRVMLSAERALVGHDRTRGFAPFVWRGRRRELLEELRLEFRLPLSDERCRCDHENAACQSADGSSLTISAASMVLPRPTSHGDVDLVRQLADRVVIERDEAVEPGVRASSSAMRRRSNHASSEGVAVRSCSSRCRTSGEKVQRAVVVVNQVLPTSRRSQPRYVSKLSHPAMVMHRILNECASSHPP